jgi:Uma2 family endonuclease/FtsZ-binding cell division protein ZapB
MSAPPEQRRWNRDDYEAEALRYWASLPPEHTMESTPQSIQREICQESLALVRPQLPQVHYFGELLVQQFHEGQLIQVCPGMMVVIGDLVDRPRTCFVPEDEGSVFWTLEFVSHTNPYGDYTTKRELYEKLRIPYYMIHDPEAAPLVLTLYRFDGHEYQLVPINVSRRYPIPELDIEVGVIAGWARFWFRGVLLELPAELQRQVKTLQTQVDALIQAHGSLQQAHGSLQQAHGSLQQEHQTVLQERDSILQERNAIVQERDTIRQEHDKIQQEHDKVQQANTSLQQSNQTLQQERDTFTAALRLMISPRAKVAGRQDILDALPTTTDAATLTAWLAELA